MISATHFEFTHYNSSASMVAKYAPVEHPTLHVPVPAQPLLRCGRIPIKEFDLRPIFAKPTATLTATDLAFPEITPAPLSPPAPDAACVVAIKTEAKLVQEQPQPIAGFFIDGLAMLGALLPTACAPAFEVGMGCTSVASVVADAASRHGSGALVAARLTLFGL